MAGEGFGWGWVVLTALFFAIGFGLSWIRMRRKLMARYQQAVEQEFRKRVRDEVLKQIAGGENKTSDQPAADEKATQLERR